MAIYHASFQVIKRSEGRSSVAAIAYRSGERLIDEHNHGKIHDYTKKPGVDATFSMAPNDAPAWVHDRATLWNTVEKSEKRKDAQLARELNVALPVELSKNESRELLEDYVKKSFIQKGMVADVAMHNMDTDNPHAHVMLTMRSISADGFGPKNRDWNSKDQVQEWRQEWAHTVNKHLEIAGQDARIDHRSLKAQGIERAPTVHVGPKASAMEARGVPTRKGDENRQVKYDAHMLKIVQHQIAEHIQSKEPEQQPQESLARKLQGARERNRSGESQFSKIHTDIVREQQQRDLEQQKREPAPERSPKRGPSIGH